MIRTLVVVVPLLLSIGCAGSGEGLDANGRPVGGGAGGSTGGGAGADTSLLTADFKSIQDAVFTPMCITCHAGGAAPRGLRLEEPVSFSMLVNVPSDEAPNTLRVAPGDPDNSYLIHKLEGTAAVGGRMPLNGPQLPQADIDVIRQWITAGALPPDDAGTTPAGTPPTVTSISVQVGSTLDTLPAQITVTFSADMDAALVTTSTLVLERSGGDGSFGDGNDIALTPASVALTPNARTATMDLSNIISVDDTYRLTAIGSGGSAVADVAGEVLDGDGDGAGGGDHTLTFDISTPPPPDPLLPTLQSIQDKIFTPICTRCHAGGNPPGDLSLQAGNSFGMIVNVPSKEESGILRVNPGNANDSYLIQVLEGTAPSTPRMPRGGPFLPQADIDIVREWIDNGAQP